MSGTTRVLRRWAGALLPEVVKAPFRGRLYGFRPPRAAMRAEFRERDGMCVVTIDGTLELRAPLAVAPDLRFHLLANGESMDEIANLLQVARDPGGLLFDVGGHISLLAHLFCLASPRNRAVSYEPSPSLRRLAEQMRALNGLDDRLTLSASAIGDRAQRLDGYVDANGLIAFGDRPATAAAVPVQFTTIDAECDRLGESPGVVKIDIEGFEDRALAGAERLLGAHPPILLLELHLDLLERRGASARALVEGLSRHGYRFRTTAGRDLSPRGVHGSPAAVIRFMAVPPRARR